MAWPQTSCGKRLGQRSQKKMTTQKNLIIASSKMPEIGFCEPCVYKPVYKVTWADSCEKAECTRQTAVWGSDISFFSDIIDKDDISRVLGPRPLSGSLTEPCSAVHHHQSPVRVVLMREGINFWFCHEEGRMAQLCQGVQLGVEQLESVLMLIPDI